MPPVGTSGYRESKTVLDKCHSELVEESLSFFTANLQRATRLRQSILQQAFSGML
jgi:hypothetical protein